MANDKETTAPKLGRCAQCGRDMDIDNCYYMNGCDDKRYCSYKCFVLASKKGDGK